MTTFNATNDRVNALLTDLQNTEGRVCPTSDIAVTTLSILAGMGYSRNRLEEVAVRLHTAEAGGIEYEEDVERHLNRAGIASPRALRIAQNALMATGHLSREMSEAELVYEREGLEAMLEKTGGELRTGRDTRED